MKNLNDAVDYLETTASVVIGSDDENTLNTAINFFECHSASSMFAITDSMENEGADLSEAEIEEIDSMPNIYYYRLTPYFESEEEEDESGVEIYDDFVIIEDKAANLIYVTQESNYGDTLRTIWTQRLALSV